MEPATRNDIWTNFLAHRAGLPAQVEGLLTSAAADRIFELETNDNYAAGMARVHCFRVSAALPAFGDIPAQASYWKQPYNTPSGRGTTARYRNDWTTHGGPAVTFRSSCS